jgi:DNA polymerase-3 subunit delta'
VSWKMVCGHDAQIKLFQRSVQRGRLAHAYLFLGTEGIGKRRFALELAKAVNCEAPPADAGLTACDACASCRLVDAGNHPDVELLGLAADMHEFPIEDIRALIGRINLKPARGVRRVIIMDDAASFSVEAANAFLKTLEEPPPLSLLILIGEHAEHFLPTILSRCQVVRFRPLPIPDLAKLLVQQEAAANSEAAEKLAREAQGALALARLLADPGVQEFRKEWFAGFGARQVDPVAMADRLTKFVEEAGADSAARRRRAQLALRFLLEMLSQALASEAGAAAVSPLVQRLGARLGQRRILDGLEHTLEAEQALQRYQQLPLVLEALTDALCRPLLQAAAR